MSDTKFVNVHDAKTNFSRLLAIAESGGEVVIAKAGRPVAKLVPYGPAGQKRRLGILAGRMKLPDDFDAALPDDVLDAFERS